jgi:hypothetical protein
MPTLLIVQKLNHSLISRVSIDSCVSGAWYLISHTEPYIAYITLYNGFDNFPMIIAGYVILVTES